MFGSLLDPFPLYLITTLEDTAFTPLSLSKYSCLPLTTVNFSVESILFHTFHSVVFLLLMRVQQFRNGEGGLQ